jgi:hypothetical protein
MLTPAKIKIDQIPGQPRVPKAPHEIQHVERNGARVAPGRNLCRWQDKELPKEVLDCDHYRRIWREGGCKINKESY